MELSTACFDLYVESRALINIMETTEIFLGDICTDPVEKASPSHDTEQSESQMRLIPIICQHLDQCIAHNDSSQVISANLGFCRL